MNSMANRRWDRYYSRVIIEKTLDGNIHVTNVRGNRLSEHIIIVDNGVADLTKFDEEYADNVLRPTLEDAGYDLVMSEPDERRSAWESIKHRVSEIFRKT